MKRRATPSNSEQPPEPGAPFGLAGVSLVDAVTKALPTFGSVAKARGEIQLALWCGAIRARGARGAGRTLAWEDIPPSLWRGRGTVGWEHGTLDLPSTHQGFTDIQIEKRGLVRFLASSAPEDVEQRCGRWLAAQVKQAARLTKSAALAEARAVFGAGLAERAFERVWSAHVPKSWRRAGRPARKSPR